MACAQRLNAAPFGAPKLDDVEDWNHSVTYSPAVKFAGTDRLTSQRLVPVAGLLPAPVRTSWLAAGELAGAASPRTMHASRRWAEPYPVGCATLAPTM